MLTVTAEKQKEKERTEDNYTRREFRYSSFSRIFNLPISTNEERVDAEYRYGVLKLNIAKKQESKGKHSVEISIK